MTPTTKECYIILYYMEYNILLNSGVGLGLMVELGYVGRGEVGGVGVGVE